MYCLHRLLKRGEWVLRDKFFDICLLAALQRVNFELIIQGLLMKPGAVAGGNFLLARCQVPAQVIIAEFHAS